MCKQSAFLRAAPDAGCRLLTPRCSPTARADSSRHTDGPQVFLLLHELTPGIDRSWAPLATQCLETLTEMVQGQSSLASSRALLTQLRCLRHVEACLTVDLSSSVDAADYLSSVTAAAAAAATPTRRRDKDAETDLSLRAAAATLLLALVEGSVGHSRDALRLMRRELTSTPTLAIDKAAAANGNAPVGRAASDGGQRRAEVPLRRTLEEMIGREERHWGIRRQAAFQLYILMTRLVEDDGTDPVACRRWRNVLQLDRLPKAASWLQNTICHVEIKNKRGELEEVRPASPARLWRTWARLPLLPAVQAYPLLVATCRPLSAGC